MYNVFKHLYIIYCEQYFTPKREMSDETRNECRKETLCKSNEYHIFLVPILIYKNLIYKKTYNNTITIQQGKKLHFTI